ncbi:hypothetical protein RUM43_013654 [Polyplax serrata]|uniref:Uncharacterized protein n=1 Tax=Polyplax serrata TaxID=468196 RepID=A0AAN8P1Y6_POLSC
MEAIKNLFFLFGTSIDNEGNRQRRLLKKKSCRFLDGVCLPMSPIGFSSSSRVITKKTNRLGSLVLDDYHVAGHVQHPDPLVSNYPGG